MQNFESRLSEIDDGQKGEAKRTDDPWQAIKASSVAAFASRVASCMGSPKDRRLIAKLVDMALSNGAQGFDHAGSQYTGPHVLMIYRQGAHQRVASTAPFKTRAEWDAFVQALRIVRDPNSWMPRKDWLLSLGDEIEARQRPHAEQKGWA